MPPPLTYRRDPPLCQWFSSAGCAAGGGGSAPMARAQRCDAVRNRDCLVEVASEAFAAKGVETSLEEIARPAGVGIGTLYRHLPPSDAVFTAVYRRKVGVRVEAGNEL